MKTDFLEEGLRNVATLEERYRQVAEWVRPSELEENPVPAARAYMAALRGLERCTELRLKLIREAGRLPEPEADEPLATVDLGRLSDGALREVEAALVPAAPRREEKKVGEENLCEKKIHTSQAAHRAEAPTAEPGMERSRTEGVVPAAERTVAATSAGASVATAFRPVTGTGMFRPAGAEPRTAGAAPERNSAMIPDAEPDISRLQETDALLRTGAAVFRPVEAEAPLQPPDAGIPPPETTNVGAPVERAPRRGAGAVSGGRLRSSG